MKNIVFDVNVVLDLWLERRPTDYLCTVSALPEFGERDRYQCWICASSLHVLEYIARRELKKKGADPLEANKLSSNSSLAFMHTHVLPVSEDCASRVLSLPMHRYMGKKEMVRIVEILKAWGKEEGFSQSRPQPLVL